MSTRTTDVWAYSGTGWGDALDITGYKVEALDGSIGKVDRATYQTKGSYIVVDTGPWIFGKKVLLPAGVGPPHHTNHWRVDNPWAGCLREGRCRRSYPSRSASPPVRAVHPDANERSAGTTSRRPPVSVACSIW